MRLGNGIYASVFIHVDQDKNIVGPADSMANIIMPDNERIVLKRGEFTVTAVKDSNWTYDADKLSDYSGINDGYEGMEYPQTFKLDFKKIGLIATIKSIFPEQYGYWYWEGFCNVDATWKGKRLSGFSVTDLWYPKK